MWSGGTLPAGLKLILNIPVKAIDRGKRADKTHGKR
jgi:hypothetical protein